MPDLLPERFRNAHDIALDLHDNLVHLLLDGMKHGAFQTGLEFRSEADAAAFSQRGDVGVVEWLEEHDYPHLANEITAKVLFEGLVGDFCHYVLEGLRNSEKAKITVAWTLFRKAFKDNLFYLEWMLADQAEFLHKFNNEGPRSIDISRRESVPKEKVVDIIAGAIAKTQHPGWAAQEFLFDLRYSKQHPEGLEGTWNKASHLITFAGNYATERRNLNFIFSGEKELASQWEHIYYYVPFLVYHSVLVVEALAQRFTGANELVNLVSSYHRDAGFYLWSMDIGFPRTDGVCVDPKYLFRDLKPIECPHCHSKFKPKLRQMLDVYRGSVAHSNECGKEVDLLAIHFAAVGEPDPRK